MWCTALINKFKESISMALDNITREAYTIENVRKKKDISSYVFAIVQYVKGANVKNIEGQLAWTYKKLAPELAQDIPRPTRKTTINKFIASLEDMKEIWYKIYGKDQSKTPVARLPQQTSPWFMENTVQQYIY